MKAYAVELLFDQSFDSYVREIWNQCSSNQYCSYMNDIDGIEPHIALAVYNDVDRTKLVESFVKVQDRGLEKAKLIFDSVAIFKATKVIHLHPNSSHELMDYMNTLHDVLSEFEEQCSPFYVNDRWNPHVTLSKGIDLASSMRTMGFIVDIFEPIEAIVESISLIEIKYNQEGKCIGSEKLSVIDLL